MKHVTGHKKGFTLVELIIAIAIIAILATISVVGYGSYQKRVRDAERKSDVTQLAAALKAYALQNADLGDRKPFMETGSGCGLLGNGNGWANIQLGGIYPESIASCLQRAGTVGNADDFIDPTGCRYNAGAGCVDNGQTRAYMKVACLKNGKVAAYIMAALETEPRKDAEVDALCDAGSVAGFSATDQRWGTSFGMNFYVPAS